MADLSIAAALCYHLAKSRGTHYIRTNSLVTSLMQYTIQTGLFAAFWSAGSILTFGIRPQTELPLIFYLPLSKVYVNALLASLNARESLREKSRFFMSTPHDICFENVIDIVAINRHSLSRRSAFETMREPGLSTEEVKDNKVIAIQVQVDSETTGTRDCAPDQTEMTQRTTITKPANPCGDPLNPPLDLVWVVLTPPLHSQFGPNVCALDDVTDAPCVFERAITVLQVVYAAKSWDDARCHDPLHPFLKRASMFVRCAKQTSDPFDDGGCECLSFWN
ncbi:hypothetical protein SCHPADRAFT_898677 [Schizopora paradoxa]|uniref:DUF6534 domain-containing protein n=1 Tax=Schizopora paradoxa TaxID=27342 RepID=A0A0H2SD93_9AGAM|nr:hypothetical protein SCHPADRAFT_898677 [Schizopora paradoxa]